MRKTVFTKHLLTLLVSTLIFTNSLISQVENNPIYDYKLSVKSKNGKSKIVFKAIYQNNCFISNDNGLVLGAYKIHKVGNDGVTRALGFYQDNKNHLISISDKSGTNGDGDANINLGFLTGDINFCKSFSNNEFVFDADFILMDEVFKNVAFTLIEDNGMNSGDFKLISIPLVDSNSAPINKAFREVVFVENHKALSRNYFVIWNKKLVPELPEFIKSSEHIRIQTLFSGDLIEIHTPASNGTVNNGTVNNGKVNNGKVNNGTSNGTLATPIPEELPKETTEKEKVVEGIEVFFEGDCPDNMKMMYKISGLQEEPKTIPAITKNNKIFIPFKFPAHMREWDELKMEITPPAAYYLKTANDKSKKIDQTFVSFNITKSDKLFEININRLSKFHIIYVDVNTFSKKKALLRSLRDSVQKFEANNDKYLLFLANNINPSFASTKNGFYEILGKIQSQNLQPGRFSTDWQLIAENLPEDFLELHKLNPTSIVLVLSENIYSTRRKDIIDEIVSGIGENSWNIYLMTDFKPKKYLKSTNSDEIIIHREPTILK